MKQTWWGIGEGKAGEYVNKRVIISVKNERTDNLRVIQKLKEPGSRWQMVDLILKREANMKSNQWNEIPNEIKNI